VNTPVLQSIHHAAIICSDYPRSKAFYTEVLGLRVVAENYREAHRRARVAPKHRDCGIWRSW
jgi:catechol 2,3-dioxygenase-like lactoylglutathione lyase family enzyme